MQIIFVGLVIAAYIVQCGAAMAVVFAHAQEKAKGDGDLTFWPALSRWLTKQHSPEQPMR